VTASDDFNWDGYYDDDDWWQPYGEATALDFELWRVWQDVLSVGFAPWLDVRWARRGEPALPSPPPDPGALSGDDFAAALHQHLQLIASNAGRAGYLTSAPFAAVRDQLRAAIRQCPALLGWFTVRPGPGVIAFLLAPFWIRSLDTWSAPDTDEVDAVGRSLIDHVLIRQAVPPALYQPWRSAVLPRLKWVSWLALFGRGASVTRAGSRFGWAASSKLLTHLHAAPSDLTPVDALIWAEVMHAGGSPLEFDRLRGCPGYVFDPTATESRPELRFEDEGTEDCTHTARNRRFLLATVEWLVRHRAELDAHDFELILQWALHRHIEDLAHGVPNRARFSWRGRTPASALEQAREYDRQLRGHAPPSWPWLKWRPRGWDRELRDGVGGWTVRELINGTELAEESVAMRHCVASYAYRCARGLSTIFSVSLDQVRRVTVEVEPRSRRVVQCRGLRNRGPEPRELEIVQRWLASLDDDSGKGVCPGAARRLASETRPAAFVLPRGAGAAVRDRARSRALSEIASRSPENFGRAVGAAERTPSPSVSARFPDVSMRCAPSHARAETLHPALARRATRCRTNAARAAGCGGPASRSCGRPRAVRARRARSHGPLARPARSHRRARRRRGAAPVGSHPAPCPPRAHLIDRGSRMRSPRCSVPSPSSTHPGW
jgi:hypothetical protein